MDNLQNFFKDEFSKPSSFAKIFGSEYVYIDSLHTTHWNRKFQIALLQFLKSTGIIKSENTDLKNLNTIIDPKYLEFKTVGKNNNSRPLISDLTFDFINSQEGLYHKFVKWLYTDVIKKDFYFQKIPTIRFHMPVEVEWHQPAWHCDSFLGHSPREMNVWFGVTENNHSDFWVKDLQKSKEWFEEYHYDRNKWKDICYSGNDEFDMRGFEFCQEVESLFNTIFLFDSRCIHASTYRSPRDHTTKISIDIRLLLVEDYEWTIIDGSPVFKGDGICKAEWRPGSPHGYHGRSVKNILLQDNKSEI